MHNEYIDKLLCKLRSCMLACCRIQLRQSNTILNNQMLFWISNSNKQMQLIRNYGDGVEWGKFLYIYLYIYIYYYWVHLEVWHGECIWRFENTFGKVSSLQLLVSLGDQIQVIRLVLQNIFTHWSSYIYFKHHLELMKQFVGI